MTVMCGCTAGDQSHHDSDSEPSASAAGRFQLRPSALDKHAASLFKGNDVHVQYVNMYCSLHIVTVSYCVCIAVLYTVYATSPTVSSTRPVYTPLNAWRLCIPDDCGKSLELSAAVHPSRTPLQLLPFVVNSRLYC